MHKASCIQYQYDTRMGNKNVVGSLVKRRARIMGKIRTLEKEADDLRVVADALGMSIKTFDPTYRVNSIKAVKTLAPRNVYFKNREGTRSVMDVLRESGEPLTIEDIAKACGKFSQEPITRSNRLKQIASIRTIIYKLQARNLVKEVSRGEGIQKWRLV